MTVDSYSVFRWPEFRALCERLGVPWDLPTTALTVRLEMDKAAAVTHEYLGRDLHGPPDSAAVDTTSLHNERFRTKAPQGGTR